MEILARALKEDSPSGLGLELCAGDLGLDRTIGHRRVQKSGLALAGFVSILRPGHIQVLGKTEITYLRKLSAFRRREVLLGLLDSGLACIVVSSSLELSAELVETANERGVAVFRGAWPSSELISRLHLFLDEHLSPELSMHGVMVDVFGVGILLMGQSGIGKSECALDLVLRGHRLISDDMVIAREHDQELIARGPPLTRHHMEVRGLGIINVRDLFGAAAVREQKTIELIVEMIDASGGALTRGPGTPFDRVGTESLTHTILKIDVTKVVIPVRPGRNMASIVEVAARNHLLLMQGHHSAREFADSLQAKLLENSRASAAAARVPGDLR